MRGESSLVGHVGRVCVLAKIDRSLVRGPAQCHHTDLPSIDNCIDEGRGALLTCRILHKQLLALCNTQDTSQSIYSSRLML